MSYRRATARCSTRGQPRPQVAPPSAPQRLAPVPRGTRTGQPLPQAEAGDAKHRDWIGKTAPSNSLRPRAFLRTQPSRRDRAADATPGGRPLFLAYARATSAGAGLFPKTVFVRAHPSDVLLACRLQPTLSARWRKSIKQLLVVWSISYSSSRARGPYLPQPYLSARQRFILHSAHAEVAESLFRRGARGFERTGLKPAGLRLRRGGAPKGRFIGHPAEKSQLCPRALAIHSISPSAK